MLTTLVGVACEVSVATDTAATAVADNDRSHCDEQQSDSGVGPVGWDVGPVGIEPNPSPAPRMEFYEDDLVGIAPLPSPHPRPEGLDPGPITIAPLPSPHPRPEGLDPGPIGIERV